MCVHKCVHKCVLVLVCVSANRAGVAGLVMKELLCGTLWKNEVRLIGKLQQEDFYYSLKRWIQAPVCAVAWL